MKNKTPKPKPAGKRKIDGDNLHVVPRNDGWAVRIEGSSRTISIHTSQREAIEDGRKLAKDASTLLVIHRRDGRIRERYSYASDPLPPRQPRKVLYPSTTPQTGRQAIRKAVREAIREVSEKHAFASKPG